MDTTTDPEGRQQPPEEDTFLPPHVLALFLTAPVSTQQAKELKSIYDLLTSPMGQNPPIRANACTTAAQTLKSARPPLMYHQGNLATFLKWRDQGTRRRLIEALEAEAGICIRMTPKQPTQAPQAPQ